MIGGGGGGDSAVGLDGATPVILEYSDSGGRVDWRRHTGGSLNAKANWPATGQPLGEFTYFSMGEGPLGLYAAGRIGSQMTVRRFTGAGWAAPTVLSASSGPVTAITQDAGRRLHVLYPVGTDLRYAASDDGPRSARVCCRARPPSTGSRRRRPPTTPAWRSTGTQAR